MKRKAGTKDGTESTGSAKFIRSFEHVDGNWPSHVYLAGKYGTIRELRHLCLQHFDDSNADNMPVIPIEAPHLSLSKPFVLRFHQIIPFLKALSERIRHIESFAVQVASRYRLLENETQTRRFIALDVEDSRGHIVGLVNKVSDGLQLFQQPAYYQDPIFHISIASMLLKPLCAESIQPNTSSDEEGGCVDLSTKNNSTVYTVTRAYKDSHASNQPSGPLGDDSDSSDEDSIPAWQRYIVPLVQLNPITSILAVPERSASATAGAKDTSFGLFDDYGSDNDDVSAPTSSAEVCVDNSNSCTKELPAVPALTKLLRFTAVECKIGNRLYRLDLRRSMHSSAAGGDGSMQPNFDAFHDKDSFYEMK